MEEALSQIQARCFSNNSRWTSLKNTHSIFLIFLIIIIIFGLFTTLLHFFFVDSIFMVKLSSIFSLYKLRILFTFPFERIGTSSLKLPHQALCVVEAHSKLLQEQSAASVKSSQQTERAQDHHGPQVRG